MCDENSGTRQGSQGIGDIAVGSRRLFVNPSSDLLKYVRYFSAVKDYLVSAPRPLPENYHSAYQRWKAGAITDTTAAKECGIPLSTFRYRAEIYEKAKLL